MRRTFDDWLSGYTPTYLPGPSQVFIVQQSPLCQHFVTTGENITYTLPHCTSFGTSVTQSSALCHEPVTFPSVPNHPQFASSLQTRYSQDGRHTRDRDSRKPHATTVTTVPTLLPCRAAEWEMPVPARCDHTGIGST